MRDFKITFLNHASFIIQNKNFKICIDPYLFGSAFNNGWNLISEENHQDQLKDITHIFYSHEHPDHFSIPFLKSIEKKNRKNIEILYQETFDKRLKKYCENQGFNFRELKDNSEENFDNDVFITCGKVPFFDSWVNFKINNINILNVNDCVLEQPDSLYKIKKVLNREIQFLFTQFSYANSDTELDQKSLAIKQLRSIKLQDEILKPKNIIPFASFIYFSNIENKFMNQNINSIQNAFDYVCKNCKANPIILKPNMVLDETSDKNNKISLDYWNEFYNNFDKLKYHSREPEITENELINKCNNYLNRIKQKNNYYLIALLFKLKFFNTINFYVTDIKKYFSFNLIEGLNSNHKLSSADKSISLNSNSLSFIFDYDFGFDTLGINARFKCDKDYFMKVKKSLSIGPLNNTGRYIKFNNFYKFVNLNFIKRTLDFLSRK
tara:strand:+ start:574 stop:1884 length:1311 start_codon:yes stop_codon:yes gene_type:complete